MYHVKYTHNMCISIHHTFVYDLQWSGVNAPPLCTSRAGDVHAFLDRRRSTRQLVALVTAHFPAFQDHAVYRGRQVALRQAGVPLPPPNPVAIPLWVMTVFY